LPFVKRSNIALADMLLTSVHKQYFTFKT